MGRERYKRDPRSVFAAPAAANRCIASSTRSRGELKLLPIATYAGRQSLLIVNCAPPRRVDGVGAAGPAQALLPPRVPGDAPARVPRALLAAALECRSTTSPAPDPRRRPVRATRENHKGRESADAAADSRTSRRCGDWSAAAASTVRAWGWKSGGESTRGIAGFSARCRKP